MKEFKPLNREMWEELCERKSLEKNLTELHFTTDSDPFEVVRRLSNAQSGHVTLREIGEYHWTFGVGQEITLIKSRLDDKPRYRLSWITPMDALEYEQFVNVLEWMGYAVQ